MQASTRNSMLLTRSRTAVWHPCTQMKQHETLPLIPVAYGKGCWLYDHDGRRYLDAVSSWWVNLFGHANARINAALVDQLSQFAHVMLAGFTHAPVVELSERLSALTGGALGHCFYGSDGASATEIALKMSFHYWRNSGPAGQDAVREPGGQLPRRDARRAFGHRRRALQGHLRAAAAHERAKCRAPTRGSRRAANRTLAFAAPLRCGARGSPRSASPAASRRSSSSRSCRARRAWRCTIAEYLRLAAALCAPLRRSPDRRRDHDRLRPHRHVLRVRAGGHHPGFPVPFERHHRRLSSALGRAHARFDIRRFLRRRAHARLPALALVYRQCARVPRGARDARHLRR